MVKMKSVCCDIISIINSIKKVQDDIGNDCSFRPVPINTVHLTLFSFRDMLTKDLEKEIVSFISQLNIDTVLEFESIVIIKKNIVVVQFKENAYLNNIHKKIMDICKKHIVLPDDKIRNYTPHITIGKVKDDKKTFEYHLQNLKINKLILY